eukprot:Selendium_serpulae@DN5857_c1_g1_i4.p2
MGGKFGEFANPCGHCRQALVEFGDIPLYLGRVNDDGGLDLNYKTSSTVVKMHGYTEVIAESPYCQKTWDLGPLVKAADLKSRYSWKTEGKIGELCVAAINAAANAYAPYSKFPVGAAVMNEKSVLFTGCNVENRYIGAGICAECVAISKALAAGSKKIKSIAIACVSAEVVAMPCGRCRQFIIEFGDVTVYPLKINGKDGTYEFEKNFKISDLLPDAFCPKSLKTAAAHPLSNVGATAKAPAKK